MILPALMIVQTLPTAAPEPGSAFSAVARPCAAGPEETGEVVVCARPRAADRLAPLPPVPGGAERPFDPLGFRLPGGGTARLHAFQNDLPGATSQGVAVTLKVPLGGRR